MFVLYYIDMHEVHASGACVLCAPVLFSTCVCGSSVACLILVGVRVCEQLCVSVLVCICVRVKGRLSACA